MLIIVLTVLGAGLWFKFGSRFSYGVQTDLFEVVKAPKEGILICVLRPTSAASVKFCGCWKVLDS